MISLYNLLARPKAAERIARLQDMGEQLFLAERFKQSVGSRHQLNEPVARS